MGAGNTPPATSSRGGAQGTGRRGAFSSDDSFYSVSPGDSAMGRYVQPVHRSPRLMRTVHQTGTDSPVLTFHFPTVDGAPRPIRFERPVRVIEARRLDDVRPALAEVERETAEGAWAAGFVTYEAAPAFDPDLVVRNGARMPLAWFGIFDAPGSVAAAADGDAEIMDA